MEAADALQPDLKGHGAKEMRRGSFTISGNICLKKKKGKKDQQVQPWSHQATNQGRSIKKSWLSHILQDVATRCFMSYTVAPPQRSAFVQSLFSPHCTVSQSLPNTLTYGQSAPFSDLFTYLRFGWCSAPRARPGSHSFQWSSGIAPGITKQTKKRKWNYFFIQTNPN